MTDTRQPMDWIRVHCQPRGDMWEWPSGYTHSTQSSVAMVTMHQVLGMEPTDLITAQLMCTLVDRVTALEKKIADMASGNMAADL